MHYLHLHPDLPLPSPSNAVMALLCNTPINMLLSISPLPGDGGTSRSYRGLSQGCVTYVRARSSQIRLSDCISPPSLERRITYCTVRALYSSSVRRPSTNKDPRPANAASRCREAAGALNRVNFGRRRLQYITRCNMSAVQLVLR